MAGYFRNIGAWDLLITQQDKRVFVLSAAEHLIYTAMETSGMLNLCNNIIHLFTQEQISIYASQDNSLKTKICSQNISYHEWNIYEHICENTSFNHKYELLWVKNIYINIKKISLQYEKTATCNILVSESSGCTTQVSPEVSDVPAEIARKLSTTSYENPTWHTDVG